uniref:diacylglycerol O-acyltransferase n=1 Tax=Plectus sambesii TaxID=2011161 RepID=A0A914UQY5_9BILA
MTKVAGIDWAPVNIPFERRMQTLAVIHFFAGFILMPIFCAIIPIYILLYTSYWWTVLVYALWFYYDKDTSRKGSRPKDWMRHARIWKHFANYFPITLVKTAELSPEKNYIMGSHPHGILSIAVFANTCTEGTNFSKTFPGIKPSLLTLVGQFWFPFRREYTMIH